LEECITTFPTSIINIATIIAATAPFHLAFLIEVLVQGAHITSPLRLHLTLLVWPSPCHAPPRVDDGPGLVACRRKCSDCRSSRRSRSCLSLRHSSLHPRSLHFIRVMRGAYICSGVAQWLACWAHNPKVRGSKPRFAIISSEMGLAMWGCNWGIEPICPCVVE
jgi:hypothetical protein